MIFIVTLAGEREGGLAFRHVAGLFWLVSAPSPQPFISTSTYLKARLKVNGLEKL